MFNDGPLASRALAYSRLPSLSAEIARSRRAGGPSACPPSGLAGLLLVGLILLFLPSIGSATVETRDAPKPRLSPNFGKLPLLFEANQGQAGPDAQFLARTPGQSLFLSPNEVTFVFSESTGESVTKRSGGRPMTQAYTPFEAIRFELLGADPAVIGRGLEEQSGKIHYLQGSDPAKWRRNISTFSKVLFGGVYPGVDLIYYGDQRRLEYDFLLAAGVDPAVVKFQVNGADRIKIDAHGDLEVRLKGREVRQHKPIIYQEIDGVRAQIEGGYLLGENNEVGFWVGKYDPDRPLVIDPVLSYSTYLGASLVDKGWAIAVDAAGNTYVGGETSSVQVSVTNTNAWTTSNAFQRTYQGDVSDAFVAKLNPTGSGLIYLTYLGGNALDAALGIAVDPAGNAYLTGFTTSPNFPTAGAISTNIHGTVDPFFHTYYEGDAFITKLDPTGGSLVYSTYLGGTNQDEGLAIALDASGSVTITGETASGDFPVVNAAQPIFGTGISDAFVAKISPTGSQVVYATYLGGTGQDSGQGVAVDQLGQAFITGYTSSFDFPVTNAISATNFGVFKILLAKFDPNGRLLASGYFGGTGVDYGFRIALDGQGNPYITGSTTSLDFPVANAVQPTNAGGSDACIVEFDSHLTSVVFATYLGGLFNDEGWDIAIDGAGNAFVVGDSFSLNFPSFPTNFPATGPLQSTNSGLTDGFITKLTAGGSTIEYSLQLGGFGPDQALGVAIDTAGSAYVTGATGSTNFATAGAWQQGLANGFPDTDAFVAKIVTPPALTVTQIGSNVVLSWPAPMPESVLERSDNATLPNWTPVNKEPTILNGRNTLAVEAADPQSFFRLRSKE